VLDFGLVKPTKDPGAAALTAAMTVSGTPTARGVGGAGHPLGPAEVARHPTGPAAKANEAPPQTDEM
jgi:hypothetical protein